MDPHHPSKICNDTVLKLLDSYNGSHGVFDKYNITFYALSNLTWYCNDAKLVEDDDKYSEPMLWVGIYVATVSFLCVPAMQFDWAYGSVYKRLWFPCKFFPLNAASITLISIAMKLPLDLTSTMPSNIDQVTKLGSLAFMCTMMAHFMPSLASMDNNALLANIMALIILVIPMIINICIQTVTGVIHDGYFKLAAYIYVSLMFFLLLMLISSSIVAPTIKENSITEYQVRSGRISNDQHIGLSMENLRQHVGRYWIMAESGNPQFVMANNPLSIACGIICAISLVFYLVMSVKVFSDQPFDPKNTLQYKDSILLIFAVQLFGLLLGSMATIGRCFTILSFRSNSIWNSNHVMVFRVETYWTKKLFDWKESPLPSLLRNQVVHDLRNFFLCLGIIIQKVVVRSCKIVELIMGIVLLIFDVFCSYSWNSLRRLFTTPIASSNDTQEDLSNYVLQIQDDEVELAKKISKAVSNSMNCFLKEVNNNQCNNLLELLEKSSGFEGVKKFDNNQFPSSSSVANVNSWSLPVITLTCIALALQEIPGDRVLKLFDSVCEGLPHTHFMEKFLNTSSEHVQLRKASVNLLHEVQYSLKWLGNPLEGSTFDGKTSEVILNWFADKAQEILTDINASTDRLIVANSMYRIAKTVLHEYIITNQVSDQEQLFEILSCMMADILSACFIANIPEFIRRKCQESLMEKEREASLQAAAKLLGRTKKIITKLEARRVPRMEPDKMIFIDEWRLHLMSL